MTQISVLSLFPQMITDALEYGVIKRAKDTISVDSIDLRQWGVGDYQKVDDESFAPGPGMLFRPDVLKNALSHVKQENSYVIHVSPRGHVLNNDKVKSLLKKEHLVIVASRYEGVDQRFLDNYIDEEISIGDYVLSGGELASLVLIDSLLRHEVLDDDALDDESFQQGLLEYPHYTKPLVFENNEVPSYLRSGNHQLIKETRFFQQLLMTWVRRPDLLRDFPLCEVGESTSNNPLTKIKKKNYLLKKRLGAFEKVIQEYKDVRRNGKHTC